MRAEIYRVKICALFAEQSFHFIMYDPKLSKRDLAPCNDRLICNNNCQIARFVYLFYRFTNPVYKLKVVYIPQKTYIFIYSTVPVKENSPLFVFKIFPRHPAGFIIGTNGIIAFGRTHILDIFGAVIAEHFPRSCQRL